MGRRKADILSGVTYKITKSKFVANNTVEYFTECGRRVIRLHDTDIITFMQPKDTIHLNTDGWKTPTTKDRMNNFGKGFTIWQDKRRWWISTSGWENKSLYYDGIQIQHGKILDPKEEDPETDRLEKLINKYCDKMGKLDKIPMPNGGDCFYCQGETGFGQVSQAEYGVLHEDGRLEKKPWEATHCLESHLEEGYVHGSLIYNALRFVGYGDPRLILEMGLTGNIRRAVRKYFRRKLGLVT